MKHLRYLKYVLRHKWFVMFECFRVGLYWRGLKHDWSKFLPSEWFPYANHFSKGIQAGRDKTGYYKPTDTGDVAFDHAWFLHQKRNDHHWQWHCLPQDTEGIKVLEMSEESMLEMICDWRGAGKAQGTPSILVWYKTNRNKLQIHPTTRLKIEAIIDCASCVPQSQYFSSLSVR